MLREQRARGRTVGLILDLSNHDCLYTPDLPPDLEYIHIQLVRRISRIVRCTIQIQ
jgi:hypothetical protein